MSEIKKTKIVAIASGKGGVGKSTLTVNCALALRERGYKVGILDADLYGPSLRALLPEESLPFEKNGRTYPAKSQGISYISLALFRSEEKAVSVRAPIANRMIEQFLHQVEWGDLDYLLIDFPPGTGDIQMTLAQKASLSAAVAVTTPQKLACLDVKKALNLFESLQVPILGIVENMSYYLAGGEKIYPFGSGGAQELSDLFGYPLLAKLPLSPLLNALQDQGENLFQSKKGICEAEHFLQLAQKIEEGITRDQENSLLIKEIVQEDKNHFRITWGDGSAKRYRLSTLQKHCPCARCTEVRKEGRELKVDPHLSAYELTKVGRYAIRFSFTSGCSYGLYSFSFLRGLAEDLDDQERRSKECSNRI